MISAPLFVGADQSITTLVPLLTVVGALGDSGAMACKNVTEADGLEYPTEFCASTVNS